MAAGDRRNIFYNTADIIKAQDIPPNADEKTKTEIFKQNFQSVFDRLNIIEAKLLQLQNEGN